ncbi:MAG TPA: hypothetical protein PK887_02390 [Ignavibacteriales bacterium]|nr:hypothetical protein [Ignavibacteriales bacterium]
MKVQTKIFGVLFFFLLVLGTFYLLMISKEVVKENKIKVIQIIGCDLLSKESYLKFAKISNEEELGKINSIIVKDRLIKHPYIKSVEVTFVDKNILNVKIKEKNIKFLLSGDTLLKAITDNFEIIPFLKETKNNNWIVVNNLQEANTKPFNTNKSERIVNIFKMIDIMKNIEPEAVTQIKNINFYDKNIVDVQIRNNDLVFYEQDMLKVSYLISKIYSSKIKAKSNSLFDFKFNGNIYVKTNTDTVKYTKGIKI